MNDIELRGLDDESRQMVVETVRQLRKKLLTRDNILEWDKKEIFPEAAVREMLGPEIGLQLLFIPEAYGGMSGGARDCCAVTREMAKICLGVGTAFFAIQLGSDPILVGATREQKEKWLGAIAEGGSLVAYAVTEPEAGSNLASLKTKAEPVDRRQRYDYRVFHYRFQTIYINRGLCRYRHGAGPNARRPQFLRC
jgi:alkylation response protein AidB-like acyl-CoA dehydrogenase